MIVPIVILLFAGTLLYSGLHDQSVTDSLRALLGRAPSGKLGSLSGFDSGTSDATDAATASLGKGNLAAAAQIAIRAAHKESSEHCYTYDDGPGRTNNGNGILDPPYTFDCSGFCEADYKAAGLPDPVAGSNYSANSYAIAASGRMQKVSASQAVPGDLVVFPDHVVVYIGNGQCVSMGEQGEPAIQSVASEAAYNNRGITGYFHMKGQ